MSSIINISEAASIAIHGVILIAKSDNYINVLQISEKLRSSKHHVAKVMQRLTKGGYIESLRGPKGGFLFLKKANEVNFLEIYELIEGKIHIKKCPFGKEAGCPFSKCILDDIAAQMTRDFRDYLASQYISKYL